MDDVTLERRVTLLKTMAHSYRLRLLLTLARGQVCDVTTLICQCGQPQPYVSQQLRVLRDSGLVVGEKHGQRICYRLVDPQVTEVLDAIGLLDQPVSVRGIGILSRDALGSRQLLAN